MNTGKTTSAKLALKIRVRNWFTRTRRIDLLTLLACILLAVGVNWVAFQAISSDMARLNILSLDEWAYTDFLNWAFYAAVHPFDPAALVTLHDPFGYGSIFWYLYGTVGAIPHFFGSFTAEILTYRIFSAMWLGVSMWLLYKIVYLIRGQYWPARFAALIVLVLPGFYFYDKAFSAEFLHLALCLATLYSFLVYLHTNNRRWCYWAAVWLGLAIGLKVSAIVFVPIIIMGFIWQERATLLLAALRVLSASIGLTIIGFLMSNPYVLLLRRAGVNLYLAGIIQNMHSNATNHGGSIAGFSYRTWFDVTILPFFFPLWFMILLGVVLLVVLYQQRKHLKLVLVIISSGLLYTAYIILTVKKTWLWYLFPGVALLVVLPMLVDYSRFHLKKAWQSVAIMGIILTALLWNNWAQIQSRYHEFIQREHLPYFHDKQVAESEFSTWLSQQSYANGIILKSPYIYFDQSKFVDRGLSVFTIWGNLSESYITGYQPVLILIEKNYGFTASDSAVGSWSSFPNILVERVLFNNLITTGLDLGGVHYHYTQVFETDNFIVYARD